MLVFWKQIGLFVQIAIVVAAVLLFSFFDPFGFLKSKKLKLENTPINVSSIKEIGELITAEYYGEVLNSLQQSRINQVIEKGVNLQEQYKEIHNLYYNSVNDLIDDKEIFRVSKWNRKNDLYNYFYSRFSSLTSNPYYQDYMKWLLTKMPKKTEKQLLKYFYDEGQVALDVLIAIDTSKIADIEKITNDRLNELSSDKKFRKQQIVVLGRGWVKAGIDFGKFTNHNFKYNPKTKTIHLIGVKPEILVCTINPWFIPERQVKGFEVILVSNKANKPKYMQMVKEATLRKLRENALKANILEKAKANAEENLKDFFSLLIDGGVRDVIIHDDFFSYFDLITTDDIINPGNMRTIDSLFVRRFDSDSMEVVNMRDSLITQKKIMLHDFSYKVQRFSGVLTLIEDEELSSGELSQIELIRDNILADRDNLKDTSISVLSQKLLLTKLDTIWYYPDNKSLKVIYSLVSQKMNPKKPPKTQQIIFTSKAYLIWDAIRLENVHRKIYALMLDRKMADYELIVAQIKDHVTQIVLRNETFVVAKDAKQQDTVIDQQTISFVDDIRKKINMELLPNNDMSIDSVGYEKLIDVLEKHYYNNKLYLMALIRDTLQYQYCMSLDCYPVGRYTSSLDLDEDNNAQSSLSYIKSEIVNALSDIDSLDSSGRVYHLNKMDSIWFYPSEFTLSELANKCEEKNPERKIINFFNKTFGGEKHKKWIEDRQRCYYNLIYKLMIARKLEELKSTKAILLNELEFKNKLKIAS